MAKSGLKKVKDIVKAFTTPLPIGEDWYNDRVEICKVCPKNIKNVDPKDYTFSDKTKIGLRLCDSGYHCTACGCCIEQKASLKTSTCGLEEVGETPLWSAVEVYGVIDKGISILNITPEIGDVAVGTNEFIYDLGKTTEQKLLFTFQLIRDKGLEVKTFTVGCSCTVGDIKKLDSRTSEFTMGISTLNFRKGITSKKMKVVYIDGGKEKEIHITFKIEKTNGK